MPDPCIAHHSGNQPKYLICQYLRPFEAQRKSPIYSAQFSEHRQNMAQPHGQNPGAVFFACSHLLPREGEEE